MTKRMLIDATHEEETRVAVIDGNRLEDFDYESQFRKALKGSIFLAKVTRVEPSLQAAFVNFGGNRHGFLPFSEIHPDYFRIPIADREALIAEQEAAMAEAEEEEEAEEAELEEEKAETDSPDEAEEDEAADEADEDAAEGDVDGNKAEDADEDEKAAESEEGRGNNRRRRYPRGRRGGRNHRSRRAEKYDDDDGQRARFNLRHKYKIQEVIKRGQIMLVQVAKEERGNKGAAVGSYLSLPGRYCVLMPNSPRAGGVSRKIANFKDRKRMREIMKELEVPKGMSVILRTAGLQRTKTEIKRDLDYLLKLWNNIRELTLQSSAPALVYEEADLIKRAVRDLYTRDVEEIIVAGDEGYKNAKNFMKMMIPSHAKRVKEYKDEDVPLFNRYKVETQIAEIGETEVTLPSGGYLVINPTEALVSIDVNSGKSTKERHIEETALRTNLEAAEEVARQLRLRDLGGLVVIDFIDMEDRRNNGKVERKMREALSEDRARVQNGRISSFGLMELSRQRLNPSLTESQFEQCPHCAGTGRIRTADATSIMVLRAIEDEGIKGRAAQVIVHVSRDVALYMLNYKRKNLARLEERYNFEILTRVDDSAGASVFRVEVSRPAGDGGDDDEERGESSDDEGGRKSSSGGRRRGRRGGRRRSGRRENDKDAKAGPKTGDEESSGEDKEKPKRSARKKPAAKSAQKDEKTSGAKSKSKAGDDKEEKPKKPSAPRSSKAKSGDKKDAAKPAAAKKDTKKESAKKEPAKKSADDKKPSSPSNDDTPASKDYEVVNQAPDEKKKGWWNRLSGE